MSGIKRETIERILDAAQIEDVVGRYVTLRRKGANLWGLCPFHDEKTPSFSVAPQKGIFKCFGCGKGGDSITFIKELEKLDYPSAVRKLGEMYGIKVEEREMTPEEKRIQSDRESMLVLNEFAMKWFEQQLWETDEGRSIGLSYIIGKRGMSEKNVRDFHIGYCPKKGSAFTDAALKAGYQEEFLIRTGLTLKNEQTGQLYDRFKARIMFPTQNRSGQVVAFGGRIMVENKDKKLAKYVNSPDSEVYHKKEHLYGIYQALNSIRKNDKVYLVEGYMDVMSSHQSGVENVVASSGTSLTEEQIQLISRLTKNIVVIYDGDAAGIHATQRGINMLLKAGMKVKALCLPDNDDPDSFSQKHDSEYFEKYFNEQPVNGIDYLVNTLFADAGEDIDKRIAAIKAITETISCIADPLTRSVYAKKYADKLNVEQRIFSGAVEHLNTQEKLDELDRQKRELERAQRENENNLASNELPKQTLTDVREMQRSEEMLTKCLVRHGDETLYTKNDGKKVTCGEYLLEGLKQWKVNFITIIYKRIVDEYRLHHDEDGFSTMHFFRSHPDEDIRNEVINLMFERDTPSGLYNKISISENTMVQSGHKEYEVAPEKLPNYLKEYLCRYVAYERKRGQNQIQQLYEEQNTLNRMLYDTKEADTPDVRAIKDRLAAIAEEIVMLWRWDDVLRDKERDIRMNLNWVI